MVEVAIPSVVLDLQSDFRTISETYVETLEVDVKAFFTLWYLKDATGKRDGGAITGSVEVIKRRGVGAGGDEGNNSSESMMRVNMDRARTEREWLPSFDGVETATKLIFSVVNEPTGLGVVKGEVSEGCGSDERSNKDRL